MPFRPYFSSVSAVYSHYTKILLFGTEKLGTEIKLYTDSKEPNKCYPQAENAGKSTTFYQKVFKMAALTEHQGIQDTIKNTHVSRTIFDIIKNMHLTKI